MRKDGRNGAQSMPPPGWREATAEEFMAAYEAAEEAIAARPPLTEAEKAEGWREDPGGSGLRFNDRTGEIDDSFFVSHPTSYREYRQALIEASRRQRAADQPDPDDAAGSPRDES